MIPAGKSLWAYNKAHRIRIRRYWVVDIGNRLYIVGRWHKNEKAVNEVWIEVATEISNSSETKLEGEGEWHPEKLVDMNYSTWCGIKNIKQF